MARAASTPAITPRRTPIATIVQSGPPFHMLEFEVAVDGETALHFSGDGLILSTPVGSTAHNLAAGVYYLQVRASSFSQVGSPGQFDYKLALTVR